MSNTKKFNNRYWEEEEGETIEFGKNFMRCYDEAGKLQLGKIIESRETGEKRFIVKFVIDRKELFGSKEGVGFLIGTIDYWDEIYDGS